MQRYQDLGDRSRVLRGGWGRKHTTFRLRQAQSGRRRQGLNPDGLWIHGDGRPGDCALRGRGHSSPVPVSGNAGRDSRAQAGSLLDSEGPDRRRTCADPARSSGQPAALCRACAKRRLPPPPPVGCVRDLHSANVVRRHSPAELLKRAPSARVPQHLDLSPPTNRFPQELSLRPPHIVRGSASFPVPPAKDPQQKGSEIHSHTVGNQSTHGCINGGY